MYSVFADLLLKFGVKASDVSKATGINQTVFSEWKKGKRTPKADKRQKIADYFGVSLEYLDTGKEKEVENAYYLNEETAKVAQEIFENKELRMLFDATRDADPEDLRALHNMALALKRKERGYIDDTGC